MCAVSTLADTTAESKVIELRSVFEAKQENADNVERPQDLRFETRIR